MSLHKFLHGHTLISNTILGERRMERALVGLKISPEYVGCSAAVGSRQGY